MLKAQSEPPQGESTQTYDQRELSRLLVETDPTLAQEVLDRAFSENSFIHPRPANEKPTIRPPALAPLSKPRVELTSTLPSRLPHDTVPDTEDEPTVMYRRSVVPNPSPFAGSTINDPSNIQLVCLSSNRRKGEELTVANPRPIIPRSFSSSGPKGIGTPKQQTFVATPISKTVGPLETHFNDHPELVKRLPIETNGRSRQQTPQLRLAMFLTWLLGSLILVVGLLFTIVTFPSYFGPPGQYVKANIEKGLLTIRPIRDDRRQVDSPPSKRMVKISIEVEPPQAKLFLDGRETSNPLKLSIQEDHVLHEIRGESAGHLSKTHRLKFDRDVSIVLGL
jgi:hypothetical protein